MYVEVATPSKTFLIGEYLVLNGGPAVLLNTPPRFSLIAEANGNNKISVTNISPSSPAEKYILSNYEFFKDLKITFSDPYHGLGGLGASSAQFGMLVALQSYLQKKAINILELIAEYQRYCWDGEGLQPSGVDLVSQFHGQMLFFHKNNFDIRKFNWPFDNLNFYLLHTGHKIATHEHLKNLKNLKLHELNTVAESVFSGLQEQNELIFCESINNYQQQLEKLGLSNQVTLDLLKTIKMNPAVVAAKGCGALGADIILVLVKKTDAQNFIDFIKNIPVKLINTNNDLSEGITIKNNKGKDEQVIVVNENDQQIGVEEKLIAHQKGILHRAFSVFVFRCSHNEIQVLLQQRSKNKYHSPGLWTNTCCSHPRVGENLLDSAQQRLADEMGLRISLQEIASFQYRADVGNKLIEHEIDHVFIGQYSGEEVHPNQLEVADYRWLEINQLYNELDRKPTTYTPWLKQALDVAIHSEIFKKMF